MIIRQAVTDDISNMAKLWLEMVRELAPDMQPNVHWWKMHTARLMQSGIYTAYIATNEEKLIGFVDSFLFPEPATGKMHVVGQHFFVVPEHRGNDVSGKLWRSILKQGKKNGAEVKELYCFGSEEKFWKRHGFKPVRTLMRKET